MVEFIHIGQPDRPVTEAAALGPIRVAAVGCSHPRGGSTEQEAQEKGRVRVWLGKFDEIRKYSIILTYIEHVQFYS